MLRKSLLAFAVLLIAPLAFADEYSVEVLKEPPPADALSKEIKAALSDTGYSVTREGTKTLCNIWLAKTWDVKPDFEATADVLYPFAEGQFVAVIQYQRDAEDFREQELEDGVYTLRYALQPIDGNHVGTFPTRDFLLVVKASDDRSPEPMDVMKLTFSSGIAAQSSHPGLFPLLKVDKEADDRPAIHHNKEDDWWILRISGDAKAGDKEMSLPIDMVVVGHAEE